MFSHVFHCKRGKTVEKRLTMSLMITVDRGNWNGFFRIRSSSSAIWNAGLSTPRMVCIELYPLPSSRCSFISQALASDIRTVSILLLPKGSFLMILSTVLYPVSVLILTPVLREMYFSAKERTVYSPPFERMWLYLSFSICLSISLNNGPLRISRSRVSLIQTPAGYFLTFSWNISIGETVFEVCTLAFSVPQDTVFGVGFCLPCYFVKSMIVSRNAVGWS